MNRRSELIGEAGLLFFGCMSASVSHEMKNALAIIRENAGLLNDYTAMIERDIPVDRERFKTVATRIDTQTRRMDGIVKNLNEFAHTVDNPRKSVDLNQLLTLFVALCRRPAAMQQVTLEAQPADAPVPITTAPFLLLNALGLWLNFGLKAIPPGGALVLSHEKSEAGACICFGRLEKIADLRSDEFPGESENALLDALGAEWRLEPEKARIVIELPWTPTAD